MVAYELILVVIQAVLISSNSRPHVTLLMLTEGQSDPDIIPVTDKLQHIIARETCHGRGNRFTLRFTPADGDLQMIDESDALTITTEGAHSCMYIGPSDRISCRNDEYCALGNNCNLTIAAVCPATESESSWMMSEAVDVTVDGRDGKIALSGCILSCLPSLEQVETSTGLSDIGICLIVAGSILAAVLITGAIIFWKIRRH